MENLFNVLGDLMAKDKAAGLVYYSLDENNQPVPCSRPAIQPLKQTKVGDRVVSTVFLSINHAFDDGPPVLWETMVFPEGDCRRYTTHKDALEGHEELVRALQGD
jgi:hypothetical protein